MLEVKIGGYVFKCKDPDALKAKLASKLESDKKELAELDGKRKVIQARIRELSKHVSNNPETPSLATPKK